MSTKRKCLSVRQPFVWAMGVAGMRVVNRDLGKIPRHSGPVLIYSASACASREFADAIEWMHSKNLVRLPTEITRPPLPQIPLRDSLARGGFVMTANIVEIRKNTLTGHTWSKVGEVCRNGCGVYCPSARQIADPSYTKLRKCPNRDRWAVPEVVGIYLDDVKPLPVFVPWNAKGKTNFFVVDDAEVAICMAAASAGVFLPVDILLRNAQRYLTKPAPIGTKPLLTLLDRGTLVQSRGYYALKKV